MIRSPRPAPRRVALPAPRPAWPAAAALPAAAPPAPLASPGLPSCLIFDISDLLDYFRHNRVPTGVQRVQLNLVREALAGRPGWEAEAVAFVPRAGAWKAVPPELLLGVLALSRSGGDHEAEDWQDALKALFDALEEAPAYPFRAGLSLVNIGTSWWLPDVMRRVREAKQLHGIRYIPFFHDCIPLVTPRHCAGGLVDEFARWFVQSLVHADAALANSENTRRDVLAFAARLMPGVTLPVHVVRLDGDPRPDFGGPPPPAARHPEVLRRAQPYVLFVSTIESRKNHLLAFRAWQRLMARHGEDAVPSLVCVGKRGWLAEPALELHAATPALRAKVPLLSGVPDSVLARLYQGCMFTLYNSFYEGWGLPVTESLAYGKVPLVADNSSLREAGGPAAVPFGTDDLDSLVEQLERLIWGQGVLARQQAVLAASPPLRDWATIADGLAEGVLAPTPAAPPWGRLQLRLNDHWPLKLLPGPQARIEMAVADVIRDGPLWHQLEHWGTWTRPGPTRLRLLLTDAPGEGILRALLELKAPPGGATLSLSGGATGQPPCPPHVLTMAPNQEATVALDLPGEAAPDITLELLTPGTPLPEPDERWAGVGVISLGLLRRDDPAARLAYLERKVLGGVLVP